MIGDRNTAAEIRVLFGMEKDEQSFRQYKDALGDALDQAQRTERRTKDTKLGVSVDRKGFRDFERQLDRADRAAKRMSRGVNRGFKIGAAGIASIGVAAAGAGMKMIQLASDAAETQTKFDIVFGKAAKNATAQLEAFSKATGASRYTLKQQAADLQALLKPMGHTEKAAADMSVGMTKLATDLSSFNNVPVEDALLAIRSGLVGEAEPLRRFGVQLSAARIEAEGMAQGIKASYNEMDPATKSQLAYSIILKDTTLAQNDAIRTSDGFANQLRKLQNQVRDTATDLGMGLMPAAQDVVTALNREAEKITPAVQAFSEKMGKILSTDDSWTVKGDKIWEELEKTGLPDAAKDAIIKGIAAAAEGGVKTMVAIFNNTGMWGKLVIGAIIAAKLAPVITGIGKLLTKTVGGVGGGLGKGGVGSAMGTPVYVTNWAQIAAGGAAGGIGGAGKAGAAGSFWKIGARGLGTALMRGVGVGAAVLMVNEVLKATGLPNLNSITDTITRKAYGNKFMADPEKLANTPNQIQSEVKRLGARRGAIRRYSQLAVQDVASASNEGRQRIMQAVVDMYAAYEKQGKVAKGTTKKVADELMGRWRMIPVSLKALEQPTRNAARGVGQATSAAAKGSKRTADAVNHQMARMTKGVKDQEEPIGNAIRRIGGFFSGLWSKAKGAGSAVWGAITGGAKALIPGLSTGGYIRGGRGQAVPAVLHGGEWVVNPDQYSSLSPMAQAELQAAMAGAPVIEAGGSYAKGAKGKGKKKQPAKKQPAKNAPAKATAASAGDPTVPGSQAFDDSVMALRVALGRAEGTETDTDDERVLSDLVRAYTARRDRLTQLLKANPRTSKPAMWRAIMSEQESVIGSLRSYESSLKDIRGGRTERAEQAIMDALTQTGVDQAIAAEETAIALADAEGKRRSPAELLRLLRERLSELTKRMAGASGEKLSQLQQAIQSTASQISGMRGSVQTPAESAAALLAARQDLYGQYGSNAAMRMSGARLGGGTVVNMTNQITAPISDPMSFSKGLAWEIRGAI